MKEERTKKEKKVSPKVNINVIKLIGIGIVALILIGYLLYAVYGLIANPTDVLMVENGTVSEEEEATGYIIREEQVIKGNNYKNGMVQVKTEGERAAKDENVFRYYSAGEEELTKKIEELDQKIDEASDAENTAPLSSDIRVLDKEIEEKLAAIAKTNDIQKIEEYKKDIQKAITKKTNIVGENSPAGSYLKQLIEERRKLENQLNSGSEYVKAPVSGMVSYKVDGLEDVLTPDGFANLNQEFLDGLNLKTGQVVSNNSECGKIVNNYECYIATIMKKEKTHDIKVGSSLSLRFSNADEVPATVEYYQEQEDDNVLVVFYIKEDVEELINYRKISFDVVFWSNTGLKVPNTAIIKENNLSYVVRSRAGYLDKILVKIIKENDTYSLIGSYDTDELKELGFDSSEIRSMKSISLYDEVLINPTVDQAQ